MSTTDDRDGDDLPGQVVRFPQSRVRPPGGESYTDLGLGKMARNLGMAREQLSGHWCSRCQGIWFGYLLEVECPVCGNRNG
ncbi:MAG TPA: hypothetical protein VHA35_09895 [Dongiaceae bacterium]|nr:hypothetical protein [Dongiaceae bacterium]